MGFGKSMKTIRPLPPADLLWELFDYDILRGVLIRRVYRCGRAVVGAEVGRLTSKGYRVVTIEDHHYTIHRLVWKWVTGEDPGVYQVDHVDQCKTNNRFWNLRLATNGQNKTNGGAYRGSSTGLKGVYRRSSGRYTSAIRSGGVLHHLGFFDTPEEAHAAYCRAAEELHDPRFWRPA